MSYSFTVRAATKSEAYGKAVAELVRVVECQPVHAADQAQAMAAVRSFISLVREDETQDVYVCVSGSCWGVEEGLNAAGVNVSVALIAKEKQQDAD